MPTYLTLGKLTLDGYDNLEQGPETVRHFVNEINAMGGSFDEDNFYVLNDEYDWAAIIDYPSYEAAAMVADIYARTGRGRIQSERVVTHGSDGYENHVESLLDAE